ncbi:MAG: hypothetical protein SXU28_13610, partial [Pseudomonadota bacterium]|nr:hypothetical protein [Pseudomonadota bacterium]
MFSAKITTRIAGAAMAGALAVSAGAAMAGVVVKSSGPSAGTYPVGKKVDDNATITLKAGDSVTVLTAKGTRVMKGAGTFRVGDNPKATRGRFAALTRKRAANRVRTGAVRAGMSGGAEAPKSPNLWYVDVSRSGKVCLFDTNTVRLWRPSSDGIATYRVIDGTSQSSIDVTFDDGEAVAAIDPARLTVSAGSTYTLAGPEGTDVA